MGKRLFRNFIAIALIGLGVMMVLANFDLVETDANQWWHYVYSIFFVVFGITLLVRYFKKGGLGWIFGSFFLIFGGLLLLNETGAIQFTFTDVFQLWPLLIVYIGFSLIGFNKRRGRSRVHIITNGNKKGSKWPHFSVGDHEYKDPNWKVEPIDLQNAAGDYFFDFTKAFIPEDEIPITVTSWAGDVQMIMPENLEFKVDAAVKAGEIDVLGQKVDGINRTLVFETANYQGAAQKLDIYLDIKAGSIRIDRA